MSLVPYKVTALKRLDTSGLNIVPDATVSVTSGASYAQLWEEEAGTTPIANPFDCDNNGEREFWILPGEYLISVAGGQSWNENIGLEASYVETELASRVKFVDSIADLTALTGMADLQRFEALSYLPGSTLGGGDFYWDAASVVAENLCTIFESDAGGTGRFIRINYDYLTPYHAGFDGTTTPHVFIQRALDTGADVYLPEDEYLVLFGFIKLNFDNQVLWGDGDETVIKLYPQEITAAGGVVKINGSDGNLRYGCKVHSLQIDYDKDNMTHTLDPRDNECLSIRYSRDHHVYKVTTVNGIHEGIDMDYSEDGVLEHNECHFNNGHGIHVSSASKKNIIRHNKCSNNGFVEFRAGIDCYEGFDLGGEDEIPLAEQNIYYGNECWDNYVNYRILGENNVAFENRSYAIDESPGADDFRGVFGGHSAWSSGDGDEAKHYYKATSTGTTLAKFHRYINVDNNTRFVFGMVNNSGVEKLVWENQSGATVFEILGGNGYETFSATFSPASGSFGSITYQQQGGFIIKRGKRVSFNFRISLSQLTIGSASGKLVIAGLPYSPQVTTACTIGRFYNWNFSAAPGAIQGVVNGSGQIEIEVFTPNGTAQTFATAADLKTGSLSLGNSAYVSGVFIT